MNMEESNNGSKKLQIRNSTAEFLIFQIENKEEGIEVLYQDETLWLTQKTMSILFDVDIRTINEHLKNEPTLKSKACLKCLYFTIIIFDLCRYLEYFSYHCTINQTE